MSQIEKVAHLYKEQPIDLITNFDKKFSKVAHGGGKVNSKYDKFIQNLTPQKEKDIPQPFTIENLTQEEYDLLSDKFCEEFDFILNKVSVLFWDKIEKLCEKTYANPISFLQAVLLDSGETLLFSYVNRLYNLLWALRSISSVVVYDITYSDIGINDNTNYKLKSRWY